MTRYIIGRISGLLFAVLIVTMITFALMHAVPGGPFDEIKQPLPEAARENILRKFGLDKPVWQQYLLYMWASCTGISASPSKARPKPSPG